MTDSRYIIKNSLNRSFLLKNGGIVVISKIGPIQFGVPSGIINEFTEMQIDFPKFFVIPSNLFEKKHLINLFDLESIVLHNYNNKRKTMIICAKELEKNIRIIFKEEVTGPSDYKVEVLFFFFTFFKKKYVFLEIR